MFFLRATPGFKTEIRLGEMLLNRGNLSQCQNRKLFIYDGLKPIVKKILAIMNKSEDLIEFVEDRLGHDYRYAINTTKIEQQLGWSPKTKFEEGLSKTVSYFLSKFSI